MKIAVTSTGPTLEDQVDARFGRCACFLVVDDGSLQFEAIENPNIAIGGGAGIQSAQLLANKGVETILTGNCGPNAFQVFGAAGIQVIVGVAGMVRDAIDQYKEGAFSTAAQPNVESHFGMGGTGGTGMGFGTGRRMGAGRGMGMGRGRGMGMAAAGGGTGRGRGMARSGGAAGIMDQALTSLRAEAQRAEERLREVKERLAALENGPLQSQLIPVVDADHCSLCAACVAVCPVDAISITDQVAIDHNNCTGCGRCVAACPQDALSLQKR